MKCTQCGLKPQTEYSPWCRQCLNTAESARRQRLTEQGLCRECGVNPARTTLCLDCAELRAIRQYDRIKKRKAQLIKHMGGACIDCGLKTDRTELYDFHHLDPTQKDFALGLCYSWQRAVEEVAKCVILCSNCHRVRHQRESDARTEILRTKHAVRIGSPGKGGRRKNTFNI